MPGSVKSFLDMLDDFLSQSRMLQVDNEKYIWKTYSKEVGVFKWLAISTAGRIVKTYPFSSSPKERMRREVGFLRKNIKGVLKPRLIIADWKHYSIIREYIEGTVVDPTKPTTYNEIAKIIAKIHMNGVVMGDTKYFNFLESGDGGIFVIDAEQAIESSEPKYMAWDLVVFLITATYRLVNIQSILRMKQYRGLVESFLKSYSTEVIEYRRVFSEFKRLNIGNTIALLLPPPFNAYLIKTLLDSSKS